MSLFHTPSVWSTIPNVMWNSRCSVLNPSDKHCSYIKPPYMHTHKHVSNQSTVKGQKGQKKTRGCTSIDSLLLCLHSNLALPRNLHGERNGLAYNDPFALTNDPTGHAPLGSFARVSHMSRKREIHHLRLSHCPRDPPPPAVVPMFTSGCPNCAFGAARSISAIKASSQPPPS